jgi:dTDP-4-amino-4,6-dideoxygalactose transaminase
MAIIDALEIKGRVLIPSFSSIKTAQAVKWCGLTPVFCDVDPNTHQICPDKVEEMVARYPDIEAIIAANLWGDVSDIEALEYISKLHGIPLIFDSTDAFGCIFKSKAIGGFGLAEVFSFHANNVLSTTEGGCVTTNDSTLAAKIRGIRPSYDSGPVEEPFRVLNSRMSEAQAAVGLLNLESYPSNQAHNKTLIDAYDQAFSSLHGIRLVKPSNITNSNYQNAVFEVKEEYFGLTRDQILQVLESENVIANRNFYPGIHKSPGFIDCSKDSLVNLDVTERLCSTCFQLPIGSLLDASDVKYIADILARIQAADKDLVKRIPKYYR